MVAKNNMAVLKKHARKVGAKCLFEFSDYKGNNHKVSYKCLKCEHEWLAVPGSIQQGRGCPECAKIQRGKTRKKGTHSIEELDNLAKKKGGRCLSKEYMGVDEKHKFKCAKGHTWETNAYNILAGKSWCPDCAGKNLSLKDCNKLAKARGGKCLSHEYKGGGYKYEWQCNLGHLFYMSYTKANSGQWCTECGSGLYERICRSALEQIFGVPFRKIRPDWLDGLELDGYNKDLKIAFEHQGLYHFKQISYKGNKKTSLAVQGRDKKKQKICKKRNVKLILIPELTTLLKVKDLKAHLVSEFKRLKIRIPGGVNNIHYDLDKAYIRKDKIKELKDKLYKINANYVVLSRSYLGVDEEHRFKCNDCKKEFERTYYNAQTTPLCPLCRKGGRDVDFDRLKKNAEKSNLMFMFKQEEVEKYGDLYPYMCLDCAEIFELKPHDVAGGRTCPHCTKIRTKERLREALKNRKPTSCYDISTLQKIAAEKEGECLSKKYINVDHKYDFACKNGHKWSTNAYNIIKLGTWCPMCSSKIKTMESIRATEKKSKMVLMTKEEEINSVRDALRWKCKKGHEITASSTNIYNRVQKEKIPCKECEFLTGANSSTHGSIMRLHELAKKKGGKCHSKKYVNSATKYRWECDKGHNFPMSANNVQSGQWCPNCALYLQGLGRRQKTLEKFKTYAKRHKGECLEKEFVGGNPRMNFKCKKGHKFTLSPHMIGKGRWCPECKK